MSERLGGDGWLAPGTARTHRCAVPAARFVYHPPRLVEGEAGLDDWFSHPRATSAASSLALLVFLPSYQNLAVCVVPCTTTVLDQAVRPPNGRGRVIYGLAMFFML